MLRKGNGYWLYSNEAGNLTLPGVGGSYGNESYAWNKLRFVNGSGSEKSVSEAGSAGWIFQTGYDYIYYFEPSINDFRKVCADSFDCPHKNSLDPWEGYFIYSNYDNITLIRQN